MRSANAIREGRPWSEQDDSDLLDCDNERWPLHQTATYLGRTIEECEARLEELKPKSK